MWPPPPPRQSGFIELSLSPSKAAVKAVTVVVADPADLKPRLKKFRSCQGGHSSVSTTLTVSTPFLVAVVVKRRQKVVLGHA